MILYIAEKPSLGRAIAAVLPKPHRRGDGFIEAGQNHIVSWCIGHLLEQAEPQEYNPAYKTWSHAHLPIVPESWKLKPKKEVKHQLNVLRKLVNQASQLVHAGDPDREGQLLVDEVLHFLGVKGSKLSTTQRCLISDLNAQAVARALQDLKLNHDFAPLSQSALARARADWLYGINMTRAYTLQGRKAGYNGVLSIGRVQTPILGLVVRRDLEIEQFVSVPYYKVRAELETRKGETFFADWVPSKACEKYLDDKQRNLSKPLAENVVKRISDKPATVTKLERKKREVPPTRPHSLSSLQIDCARAFGLSAQQVLDTCQSLYERHKLITYPRSDCRFLPEDHLKEAASIIDTIRSNLTQLNFTQFEKAYDELDSSRKTKAWNDKKVDAHHAIIPTLGKTNSLTPVELNVYSLVCRNYLCQFLATHVYYETRADIDIENGLFIARARELKTLGWKKLFTTDRAKKTNTQDSAAQQTKGEDQGDATDATLPTLKEGESLQSLQAQILERKTSPPPHFTDASLLAAMTGIALFVKDTELKKVLRETDGLGTEATRAGIIELLFRRQFLQRHAKQIRASQSGRALINALPDSISLPDRTAHWESLLGRISQREANYNDLMKPLCQELDSLVSQCRQSKLTDLKGLGNAKPKPKAKPTTQARRQRKKVAKKAP